MEKRIFQLAFLLAFVAVAFPRSAGAQFCYSCLVCYYDDAQHYVPHEQNAIIGVNENPHVFCAYPLSCFAAGHTLCQIGAKALPQARKTVLLAHDPQAVIAQLRPHFEGVEWNEDRGAIQLFACNSRLIANFPMRPRGNGVRVVSDASKTVGDMKD